MQACPDVPAALVERDSGTCSPRVISVLYNTFDFECEKSDCICFIKCAADVNSRNTSCYKDKMLSNNMWEAYFSFAFFLGQLFIDFPETICNPRPRQLALNGRSLLRVSPRPFGTRILGFGSEDCLHEPHTGRLAKSLRAAPPSLKSAVFSSVRSSRCAAGN